jgi:hypothetical protein
MITREVFKNNLLKFKVKVLLNFMQKDINT